jgi:hypothetical protein
MERIGLSKGVKNLLFVVDEDKLTYDDLMIRIQNSPELLMSAEKVTWCIPLGFVVKSEDGTKIVDYLNVCSYEEGMNNEEVEFKSIMNGNVVSVMELIQLSHVYPNYSEDLDVNMNIQLEAPSQSLQPGGSLDMAVLHEDLFLFSKDRKVFVLRKKSHVPESLIQEALILHKGSIKCDEDFTLFQNKIISLK